MGNEAVIATDGCRVGFTHHGRRCGSFEVCSCIAQVSVKGPYRPWGECYVSTGRDTQIKEESCCMAETVVATVITATPAAVVVKPVLEVVGLIFRMYTKSM